MLPSRETPLGSQLQGTNTTWVLKFSRSLSPQIARSEYNNMGIEKQQNSLCNIQGMVQMNADILHSLFRAVVNGWMDLGFAIVDTAAECVQGNAGKETGTEKHNDAGIRNGSSVLRPCRRSCRRRLSGSSLCHQTAKRFGNTAHSFLHLGLRGVTGQPRAF